MNYENYLGMNREALLEKIASNMSEKRFKHVLGVEKAAISLANQYGADTEKASIAALLHDYAKEMSDERFISLIDQYQLDPDLKNWNNNVWHGMVGIYQIKEDFGLNDKDILRAIEIHTVGAKEMTLLDKVIYVADYIEEGRAFPIVSEARKIAKESLDKAVAFETVHTVTFLAQKCQTIYPQTIDTYNAFVGFMKE